MAIDMNALQAALASTGSWKFRTFESGDISVNFVSFPQGVDGGLETCRALLAAADACKDIGLHPEVRLSYKDKKTGSWVPFPSLMVREQPPQRANAQLAAQVTELKAQLAKAMEAIAALTPADSSEAPEL
jgi:hypothetical protein